MRRKRSRRCGTCEWLTVFSISFGMGLFLSLFCSVRFALFLAAVSLVVIGAATRP